MVTQDCALKMKEYRNDRMINSPYNVGNLSQSVDRQKGIGVLIVEAPPVPAGAVEARRNEQDDQQSDEQAEAQHGGHHRPHQRPLGHVYEGRGEGHPHPACTPAVLRRVPGDVDALHG